MDPSLANVSGYIPEDVLISINRNFEQTFPAKSFETGGPEDERILRSTFENLLHTADAVDITATHRAPASSVICTLLLKCSASSNPTVRQLPWTWNLWNRAFSIHVDRADSALAKSMRKELVDLGKVFSRHPGSGGILADVVMPKTFGAMFQSKENNARVKASFQFLAHFVSKKLISPKPLVSEFSRWQKASGEYSGLNSQISIESARPGESGDIPLDISAAQRLLTEFFFWMTKMDTAPAAANFLRILMPRLGHYEDEASLSVLPVWIPPLVSCIHKQPESVIHFRRHLFPELFRSDISAFFQFLRYLIKSRGKTGSDTEGKGTDDENEVRFHIFFSALETGKELGLVREVDTHDSHLKGLRDGVVWIPVGSIHRLLAHSSSTIRFAALSLLILSASPSTPFAGSSFKALRQSLPHFHAESDPGLRGELYTLEKRLLDRFRSILAGLTKTLQRLDNAAPTEAVGASPLDRETECPEGLRALIASHRQFLKWYLEFLYVELRPTSSYQRRISALRSIAAILQSGLDASVPGELLTKQAQFGTRWPFHLSIEFMVQPLMERIMDNFDDVRQTAANALKTMSAKEPPKALITLLPEFVARCEQRMLRSGRADHADAVARSYDLLFSVQPSPHEQSEILRHRIRMLESTVDMASSSLVSVVGKYPMHGILASISNIFNQPGFYPEMMNLDDTNFALWSDLHRRIFPVLESVWRCVEPVLAADAPEGFVPDEFDLDTVTKDVLSYSWRALKEASALLRVIVSRAPTESAANRSVLSAEDFEFLGRLAFTQLRRLRHRGAFSSVASAFAACCARMASRSSDGRLRQLLETWYQETLQFMYDMGSVFTRRSAGIPSIMAGILGADLNGSLFEKAMGDLNRASIAPVDDTRMAWFPQVHAMNCIRLILTQTNFAAATEPYIIPDLDTASHCLKSPAWPIRNCGLMLFRTIMDRLLGANETQPRNERELIKASKSTFHRYPNLANIVVQLLSSTASLEGEDPSSSSPSAVVTEPIFPALQILQVSLPPPEQRDRILDLVFGLTSSPQWHIRDKAARALAGGLLDIRKPDHLDKILHTRLNSNAIHGQFLTTRYIVQTFESFSLSKSKLQALEELYEVLLTRSSLVLNSKSNPMVRGSFLDAANSFAQLMLENPGFIVPLAEVVVAAVKVMQQLSAPTEEAVEVVERSTNTLLRRSTAALIATCYSVSVTRDTSDLAIESLGQVLEYTTSFLIEQDSSSSIVLFEVLEGAASQCRNGERFLQTLPILSHSITQTSDLGVHTAIVRVIVAILRETNARGQDLSFAQRLFKADILKHMGFSPPYFESVVPLLGFKIGTDAVGGQNDLSMETGIFMRLFWAGIRDTNTFTNRRSGAEALSGLQPLWEEARFLEGDNPVALDSMLAVYDLCVDDDEDIRETGSKLARTILSSKRLQMEIPLTPLVASQRLSEDLVSRFSRSRALAIEALRRFWGCDTADVGDPQAVSSRAAIKLARSESEVLFKEEKQNLFIDPSSETVIWARVLKRMSPTALPRMSRRRLASWVAEGLVALAETTPSEAEAMRGLSAQPDIFALGMRVLYGADVVLYWLKCSMQRSPAIVRILGLLVRFVDGVPVATSQILADVARRILQEYIAGQLGSLQKQLSAMIIS